MKVRTSERAEIPIVQLLIVAVVTVVVLAPFAGKAFNIDDTLFLWTAKRILKSPLDAFGFSGNWAGRLSPAIDIIKNPPGASYYMAAWAALLGFTEKGLHAAFMLPALAVSLGTYVLAKRYTSMPLAAALVAALSPVFMVSANTVMCDMLMLAFWVWAVVLWVRGIEKDAPVTLLASGALVALSALTKYFGVSLIPLLVVYALLERKPLRLWAPGLLVPVAALLAYQSATASMYGRGLLFDAASYATGIQTSAGPGVVIKALTGLSFTGGCFIASLFYAPFIWSRKAFIAGAAVTVAGFAVLLGMSSLGAAPMVIEGVVRWPLALQFALFAAAGANVVLFSIQDIMASRDSGSALLVFWVFGVLVFTVFFNWTINGRSVLPLIPPAAILLVRKVERRGHGEPGMARFFLPLIPCLLVTVAVTWADFSLAGSARSAARYITGQYAPAGRTIWFEGHWGFQYYMEQGGARAVEWGTSQIRRGDVVVFPLNNVNLRLVQGDRVTLSEDLRYTLFPSWLATMSLVPGAGFYADEWGPVPYLAGGVNTERYLVMFAEKDFTIE